MRVFRCHGAILFVTIDCELLRLSSRGMLLVTHFPRQIQEQDKSLLYSLHSSLCLRSNTHPPAHTGCLCLAELLAGSTCWINHLRQLLRKLPLTKEGVRPCPPAAGCRGSSRPCPPAAGCRVVGSGVEPALHREVEQKQRYGFVCFWSKPPSSVPLVASKRKANFASAVLGPLVASKRKAVLGPLEPVQRFLFGCSEYHPANGYM